MRDEVRIERGGQSFVLNAGRTAFWENESMLLCSDLHWGREAFLQSRGFPVPEGVFTEEVAVLSRLLAHYRARKLFILGDLIHHPRGIHAELKRSIREWRDQHREVEMVLIPGNHDRAVEVWLPEFGIALGPTEFVHAGIRLRHEPENSPGKVPDTNPLAHFSWYGHLHPAVRIYELGGQQKFPAFLVKETEGFLPAFSRLAGGAEVTRRKEKEKIFVTAEGEIFPLD